MRSLTHVVLAALIAVLVICTAHSTLGAPDEPYPGAKLVLEVNLTDKDFLPILKQLLSTMPGVLPAEMKADVPVPIDGVAVNLSAAFAGLKSLKLCAYSLPAADAGRVVQSYGEKVGAGQDWKPMVSFSGTSLFAKQGTDALFVLAIHPDGFVTVETSGRIDLARVMKVGAQLVPLVMPSANPQSAGAETATVVRGTSYGSEGSNSGLGLSWEVHGSADVTIQEPDGKGGWRDCSQIATSPKDPPKVPRLIVRTNPLNGARSIDGYGTFEVRNPEGKAVMRLIIKSRDPKAQALDSRVRIVSFESEKSAK